jgi:hypothetical protein
VVVSRDEEQGPRHDVVADALCAEFELEAVAEEVSCGAEPQVGVVLVAWASISCASCDGTRPMSGIPSQVTWGPRRPSTCT